MNSVLAGPMGTLGTTMEQLPKLSRNEPQLCTLEKIVKRDMVCMQSFLQQKEKNGDLTTRRGHEIFGIYILRASISITITHKHLLIYIFVWRRSSMNQKICLSHLRQFAVHFFYFGFQSRQQCRFFI